MNFKRPVLEKCDVLALRVKDSVSALCAGQQDRWCLPGKLIEVANQVGLIVVTTLERDGGPS